MTMMMIMPVDGAGLSRLDADVLVGESGGPSVVGFGITCVRVMLELAGRVCRAVAACDAFTAARGALVVRDAGWTVGLKEAVVA